MLVGVEIKGKGKGRSVYIPLGSPTLHRRQERKGGLAKIRLGRVGFPPSSAVYVKT
jgi:hypothetical protein